MKRHRKGYRKVHTTSGVYLYRIGGGYTTICKADGERFTVVRNDRLKGVTPDTYERGQWKRTQDGQLYPSEVKSWIERNA